MPSALEARRDLIYFWVIPSDLRPSKGHIETAYISVTSGSFVLGFGYIS